MVYRVWKIVFWSGIYGAGALLFAVCAFPTHYGLIGLLLLAGLVAGGVMQLSDVQKKRGAVEWEAKTWLSYLVFVGYDLAICAAGTLALLLSFFLRACISLSTYSTPSGLSMGLSLLLGVLAGLGMKWAVNRHYCHADSGSAGQTKTDRRSAWWDDYRYASNFNRSHTNDAKLWYRTNADGTVTFAVNTVKGADYRWERCAPQSHTWSALQGSGNMLTTGKPVSERLGFQYRCKIYLDHTLRYCSNTATINSETYGCKAEQAKGADSSAPKTDHHQVPGVEEADKLEGRLFVYYCGNVLLQNGFTNIVYPSADGDFGVDILAEKDGISFAIQCKRCFGKIGSYAIQQVCFGRSLHGARLAVIMTNSLFTEQAAAAARKAGVPLWDRPILDNMIRFPSGLKDPASKDREDRNFFEGCNSVASILERYKQLMKTFHPDTGYGDEETAKLINKQKDELMKSFRERCSPAC